MAAWKSSSAATSLRSHGGSELGRKVSMPTESMRMGVTDGRLKMRG